MIARIEATFSISPLPFGVVFIWWDVITKIAGNVLSGLISAKLGL